MSASDSVDKALADLLALTDSPREDHAKKRKRRFKPIRWLLGLILFILLPVVILLRGSVYAYQTADLPLVADVAIGVVTATFIVFLGLWLLLRRIGVSGWKVLSRVSVILVCVYTGFALLSISVDNVKSADIRATYTSLHPLLRLSVSTFVLLDGGAVITDTGRTTSDYAAMGLETNENSLHFVQNDGYVHAIDLRTKGRSEFRNRVTGAGFRLMGFHVLRHTGTADHLHISLPVH